MPKPKKPTKQPPAPKMVRPHGRPRAVTPEMMALICAEVATNAMGLKEICEENPDFPAAPTIRRAVAQSEQFRDTYCKAKELQMLLMEDDILSIADETARDTITNSQGEDKVNGEWIARSRLRVDTRKWLMSKLAPKRYGEKQTIEHQGGIQTFATRVDRKAHLEKIRQEMAAERASQESARA